MTRRHAEVAGAGIAGLAAAIALARRGWSVRVHERGMIEEPAGNPPRFIVKGAER